MSTQLTMAKISVLKSLPIGYEKFIKLYYDDGLPMRMIKVKRFKGEGHYCPEYLWKIKQRILSMLKHPRRENIACKYITKEEYRSWIASMEKRRRNKEGGK